jgi:hypothetical protein
VIAGDGSQWVDTGDWLGWISVEHAPYIYVLSIDSWTYMLEPVPGGTGSWSYVFR